MARIPGIVEIVRKNWMIFFLKNKVINDSMQIYANFERNWKSCFFFLVWRNELIDGKLKMMNTSGRMRVTQKNVWTSGRWGAQRSRQLAAGQRVGPDFLENSFVDFNFVKKKNKLNFLKKWTRRCRFLSEFWNRKMKEIFGFFFLKIK